MIKDNRIIFGTGDIAVGCINMGLTFQQIRPPQEIGYKIEKDDKDVEFLWVSLATCLIDIFNLVEICLFSKFLTQFQHSCIGR